jgi:DnaJ-class molecular chaperone
MPNIFIIFAAIGNAAAILTDPAKREQHDLYGSDEHIQQAQRHTRGGYREYDYTRGFEGNYYIKLTIN